MDVVKETFSAQFETIKQAILSCDFVAIDTELTGLSASKKARINSLDSVEERYGKLRESASKFMTIQWGLCTFTKTSEGEYVAQPFNFYVFPKPFHPNLDYTFVSSVSSLHFLASNNFDFNKLIYHGIPWLRRDEEERIRSSRPAEAAGGAPKDDVALGDKDKAFIDAICVQIDEWLKTGEKELRLAPCNSFQRRITYQEVAKRYNNAIDASAQSDEGSHLRYIVLSRLSDEERSAKRQEKAQQGDAELEAAVGFRRVIDVLTEAKKPVVGHNLLLDLVHTLSFLQLPPPTSDQFKSQLHSLFPTIVDTKFVVSSSPELVSQCASTALGDTHAAFDGPRFQDRPAISFPAGFGAYAEDKSRFHEAGFDALITGVAYLRMAYHLAEARTGSADDLLPTGPLMEEYRNKLFLLRSDIPYYNLAGPDPTPDRAGVFYVHNFSPSLRTGDIVRHFGSFGRVFVNWVDDTSLFITLSDKAQAPHVMAHFDGVETRPPFDVLDSAGYQAWRHSLDGAPSSVGLRSPTSPLHPYAPGSLSSPYSPRPPAASSSSDARSATTGKRKRDAPEELEEGEIREEGLPTATATTEEEEEEEQRQAKRGRHEKEGDNNGHHHHEEEEDEEARQNDDQPASSCLLQ